MNNPLIIALVVESVIVVVMFAVLCWLVRGQLKLKNDYQALNDIVQGNSNDIAGLCSAALTVDSRIAAVDSQITATYEQIDDLAAKLAEVEQIDQSSHPYSGDIRKVRSGASVNELMQNSGLSHDEAALLIRLHGSKTQP
ncbi:DUF2802 domain-containing protein [Candidatus Methylobacter oryzae]|uniref:DUF2802 domain-containing protein n=1 Tax=Candidatus Methylobacter oryzae TaxID=2497749 RepID=A0ABY3CCZ1_9GAMM|nr:DUF2802 domain-containing protein [Candidatus Methylobacter oryzae]TRX00474.1 DUF2802 domain-containing protein [Candidatus Methylobacter oryzae]